MVGEAGRDVALAAPALAALALGAAADSARGGRGVSTEARVSFYHGGKGGLGVGDVLVPSPPHVNDGCPVCVARAEGRVCTVGEFRAWMRTLGPSARPVLEQLEGVPDDAPMDSPSAERAVYITTDRAYAQFYASRSGNGDLYRVEPLGPMTRTAEDHFPSWTCAAARVVAVLQRHVRLKRAERRELMRRWKKADKRAATITV